MTNRKTDKRTNNNLATKHYKDNKRSSNTNPTKIRGWTKVLKRNKCIYCEWCQAWSLTVEQSF